MLVAALKRGAGLVYSFSGLGSSRSGKIYDVVAEQRAALLRSESRAVAELMRAYSYAEQSIQSELDKVIQKLIKARAQGVEIAPAWLFQEGRLNELLAQVRFEVSRFSRSALQITTAQQALNVIQATNATGAIASAAGVRSGFVMLHNDAFTDLVGFLTDGSPLHEIFTGINDQTVEGVRRALFQSMALGRNPRVTGRLIHKAVGDAVRMSRNRAVLIARTETMRAYRVATIRNYANNPGIVQGWRWLSGRDSRCCPVCIAMDGQTFKLDEPFASHPGCRCSAVPVLSEDLDTNIGTGEEWFSEQSEDVQLAVMDGSKVRLKLWKDNDASLADMVEETDSPKWGRGRKLKALRDLNR